MGEPDKLADAVADSVVSAEPEPVADRELDADGVDDAVAVAEADRVLLVVEVDDAEDVGELEADGVSEPELLAVDDWVGDADADALPDPEPLGVGDAEDVTVAEDEPVDDCVA